MIKYSITSCNRLIHLRFPYLWCTHENCCFVSSHFFYHCERKEQVKKNLRLWREETATLPVKHCQEMHRSVHVKKLALNAFKLLRNWRLRMNCACCLHVQDLAPKILTLPNVLNTKMKLHKSLKMWNLWKNVVIRPLGLGFNFTC